jgi:hypothetical protein
MYTAMTCPVCRQDAVVRIEPLTIVGPGMELCELAGEQCTSCGHLGVQIPDPWLVRLFPDQVSQITMGRRERHRLRKARRRPLA